MKGAAIKYSNAEIRFVHKNQAMPESELHAAYLKKFKRTEISANNLKRLRLRNGWKTGRTGQYKKGNIPHPNAGTNGPNKTSFKKGDKPSNHLPVGFERTNTDGYIDVKTKEGKGNWVQKHRLIWARHNGALKKGELIRFKDGDKKNCLIENLTVVNGSEHIELNKMDYNNAPKNIKPPMLTLARVISKRNQAVGLK